MMSKLVKLLCSNIKYFVFIFLSLLLAFLLCFLLSGNVTVRGQLSIPQNNNITKCCFVTEETLGCNNSGTPYTWEDSVSTQSIAVVDSFKSKLSDVLKEKNYCFTEDLLMKFKLFRSNVRLITSAESQLKILMIKHQGISTYKRSYIDIEYRGKKINAIDVVNTYMQTVVDMRFTKIKEAERMLGEQLSKARSRMEASCVSLSQNDTEENRREAEHSKVLYTSLTLRLKEVKVVSEATKENSIYISKQAEVIGHYW